MQVKLFFAENFLKIKFQGNLARLRIVETCENIYVGLQTLLLLKHYPHWEFEMIISIKRVNCVRNKNTKPCFRFGNNQTNTYLNISFQFNLIDRVL